MGRNKVVIQYDGDIRVKDRKRSFVKQGRNDDLTYLTILRSLYPKIEEPVIAEDWAYRLGFGLHAVRKIFKKLIKEGFMSGPHEVTTIDEHGSFTQYRVGLNSVVWNGKERKWMRERFLFQAKLLNRYNPKVLRKSPIEVKRRMQSVITAKLLNPNNKRYGIRGIPDWSEFLEEPRYIEWSGHEYHVLNNKNPYREYGQKHGLFDIERRYLCEKCGSMIVELINPIPNQIMDRHTEAKCHQKILDAVMSS